MLCSPVPDPSGREVEEAGEARAGPCLLATEPIVIVVPVEKNSTKSQLFTN